jgi:hypothetical protein
MLARYADLNGFCRIHDCHDLSGRCITPDTTVGPSTFGRERAEWGMLARYADLNGFCRIHNRHDLSGRCITPDTTVGPLYLWERVGVRGKQT